MVGRTYLYVKTNWRAWLKIANLNRQNSKLLAKVKTAKKEANIVISFTTFQARIKAVDHMLRSLVAGTMLAEGIYLYIDQETKDLLEAEKGSFLNNLVKEGYLHLRVVENTRSYKKLIYAIEEHPTKNIVICDDDVLYPDYWLADIVERHRQINQPKVIVGTRAHRITYNPDGTPSPYNGWEKEVKGEKALCTDLFPTGTGGVLYPPGSMPPLTGNVELFRKYAPTNDDIWFWFCGLKNGCKFATTNRPFDPKDFSEVPDSQSLSLFTVNVHQGGNDRQLKDSYEYFNSPAMDLNAKS